MLEGFVAFLARAERIGLVRWCMQGARFSRFVWGSFSPSVEFVGPALVVPDTAFALRRRKEDAHDEVENGAEKEEGGGEQ